MVIPRRSEEENTVEILETLPNLAGCQRHAPKKIRAYEAGFNLAFGCSALVYVGLVKRQHLLPLDVYFGEAALRGPSFVLVAAQSD